MQGDRQRLQITNTGQLRRCKRQKGNGFASLRGRLWLVLWHQSSVGSVWSCFGNAAEQLARR
jgi:hypothetical protein